MISRMLVAIPPACSGVGLLLRRDVPRAVASAFLMWREVAGPIAPVISTDAARRSPLPSPAFARIPTRDAARGTTARSRARRVGRTLASIRRHLRPLPYSTKPAYTRRITVPAEGFKGFYPEHLAYLRRPPRCFRLHRDMRDQPALERMHPAAASSRMWRKAVGP